jgi:heat shock protein HtpX
MSETPTPLLVYNRIDANRRATRWLLASFVVALWPVVFATAVLIRPWVLMFVVAGRMKHTPGDVALFAYSLVPAMLAIGLATALLIPRYSSRMMLRMTGARPLGIGDEPELVLIVQNLCVGSGLPTPRMYLVDSTAPNLFATGRDPEDASLVVTRGLLRLLDRRELEGVIARELSHIGNHDIRLTTTLAALASIAVPPLQLRLIAAGVVSGGLTSFRGTSGRSSLMDLEGFIILPLLIAVSFFCVMVVSPVAALLIRRAVSRQRELLADADAALLTRDPEALAFALMKIGAVTGDRRRRLMFPSYPPLKERIALLARMGSGIAPSAIKAARDAGARVRASADEIAEARRMNDEETIEPTSPNREASGGLGDSSGEGVPSDVSASPSADAHVLIPLYERPDGWSRVLAQLPVGAVIIPMATEGNFVRVTTADNQTGYVSRSAPLAALKNLHP